ncbi:MAG: Ig-like domain-containing protein [Thermodesulfobacteriota bacterium]
MLDIPPGALAQNANVSITRLSGQGLTGLLPAGWSPVSAFAVASSASQYAPMILSVTGVGNLGEDADRIVAVRFDASRGRWVRAAAELEAGALRITLPQACAVALILPDTGDFAPPAVLAGEDLLGVALPGLPADITAELALSPEVLYSGPGVKSSVCVTLGSQSALCSGTRVVVNVDEGYALSDGSFIIPEPMGQDIICFRTQNGLAAHFPASPSRVFAPSVLLEGGIRLSVETAEEGRGFAVAGPGGGELTVGKATLSVPAGVLIGPVPMGLEVFESWDSAVPEDSRFTMAGSIAAVDVDLGGESLPAAAQLSVALDAPLAAGITPVLLKAVDVAGASRLALVAVGQVFSDRVVFGGGDLSLPVSGITEEGRYYIVGVNVPVGFVSGWTDKQGGFDGPVLVEGGGFGFVDLVTAADDSFVLAAAAGSCALTGTDLSDGATGLRTVSVAEANVTVTNLVLTLSGPEVVSVIPADKARSIESTSAVTVTFSRAMDEATLTTSSIRLLGPAGAISGTVTASGRGAVFLPAAPLAEGATYTLTVDASCADVYQNLMGTGFTSSFVTRDRVPPAKPEPGKVTLNAPDTDGVSKITGTAGAAEPGAIVFAVNGNTTISTVAKADGSFTLSIHAQLTDSITLSYQDADGNVTSFDAGLFRYPDGSYLVNEEGGMLFGEGDVRAVVPEGAVPDNTRIMLLAMPAACPYTDMAPGFQYLGGVDLEIGDVIATKEIKISIAAPGSVAFTPDTQILVLKRITVFEEERYTLSNIAHYANGRIETASPPFPGARSSGTHMFVKTLSPARFTAVYPSPTFGQNDPQVEVSSNNFGNLFSDPWLIEQVPIFAVPVDAGYAVTVYNSDNGLVLAVQSFPPLKQITEIGATFVPAPFDNGPLDIKESSPTPGAMNVSIQHGISVVFDKLINPLVAASGSDKVTVTDQTDGKKPISGTITSIPSENGGAKGFTFIPNQRLAYGHVILVSMGGVTGYSPSAENAVKGPLRSFSFTTFQPTVLKRASVATPADVKVLSDKRLLVASGRSGETGASEKGIVLLDTYSRLKELAILDSMGVYGDTLGVAAIPGSYTSTVVGESGGYTGAVVVSGGLEYLGQARALRVEAGDSITDGKNVLLCMSQPTLANGTSIPLVQPVAGIPMKVARMGDNLYVANLGVGLQHVSLGDVLSGTQNLVLTHTLDQTTPSPVCVETLGDRVLCGDMHTLRVFNAGLDEPGVSVAVAARAISAVPDFPVRGTFAQPETLMDLAFVADQQGRLTIVSMSGPGSPAILSSIVLSDILSSVAAIAFDRLVFVGGDKGVHVVDVFDPAEPRLLGDVKGVQKGTSVDLASTWGYAADSAAEEVAAFPIRPCIEDVLVRGDEYPVMPGNEATLEAIVAPGVTDVEWSVLHDQSYSLDKKQKADGEIKYQSGGLTCEFKADNDSGAGWVVVRAASKQDPTCYVDTPIRVGCSSCTSCNAEGGTLGTCDPRNACVMVSFGLGNAAGGRSAGDLLIHSESPDKNLCKPQALVMASTAQGAETIYGDKGEIRQVLSGQGFVDVQETGDYGYELRFYLRDAVQELGPDGLYTLVAGASPVRVWSVENPDRNDKGESLRLSEVSGGTGKIYDYKWVEADKDWALAMGGGLRIEGNVRTLDPGTGETLLTHTVSDNTGKVASSVRTRLHAFAWGEEVVEVVKDPAGANLAVTTTYYENPADKGSYGRVHTYSTSVGSWTEYFYDELGRLVEMRSPWLSHAPEDGYRSTRYSYQPIAGAGDANAPEDQFHPRTTAEEIAGTVTGISYHVYGRTADGGRIEITERAISQLASYGTEGNLRTTSEYYPYARGEATDGKLKSSVSADERLTTYTYEYGLFDGSGFAPGAGKDQRTTVTNGTKDHPAGIAHKTTREVSIEDQYGNTLLTETYVYDGAGYQRISWTRNTLDDRGRAVRTDHSKGTYTTQTWSCCQKEAQTDETGATTSFTYDALGRVRTQTKPGLLGDIVTTFAYDAAGRTLSTAVIGEGGLSRASSSAYDSAGRLSSSTDEAGLVTTYAYEQGGLKQTITLPGGATQISESFVDGSPKSATGTARAQQFMAYGVNGDGSQWTRVDVGAPDSPMWQESVTDFLGRGLMTRKPGYGNAEILSQSFYDKAGRLTRVSNTGSADALFEYNELGEMLRTGLDVNGNGQMDLAGPDRIQESDTSYAFSGNAWWRESRQWAYARESFDQPMLLSLSKTRITGLGTGEQNRLTAETIAEDINGNVTVSKSLVNRGLNTQTQLVDYSDSDTDSETVFKYGLTVSVRSATNVKTELVYDALGRQTAEIDPRTGTSFTHYDAAGRVDWVQDPAGNRTRFEFDPQTGRKTAEIDAKNHAIRYEYDLRGQVLRTWGATYPVSYAYDDLGRVESMSTYRGGDGWFGAAWPGLPGAPDVTRWIYDPGTGLVAEKQYNDGNGPKYTYTPTGKLLTRTWARTKQDGSALVTTYGYDPATAELLSIVYNDGTPPIGFAYDRMGNKKTVTDAAGTRTFTYNTDLSLASEQITGAVNTTITRVYDALGRDAGFSAGADYTIDYGYDSKGRMNLVGWDMEAQAGETGYTYTANSNLLGRMSSSASGAGGPYTPVTATYEYEQERNLKTAVINQAGDRLISRYDYVYNEIGNRTSVKESGEAFGQPGFYVYSYNTRNELIGAARYLGTDLADMSQPYTPWNHGYDYDPIGNRTQARDWNAAGEQQSTTYTANDLNQYTQAAVSGNEALAFLYDADGNMTGMADSSNGDYTSFYWNGENRLTAVEKKVGASRLRVTFAYDYMGRRFVKTVFTDAAPGAATPAWQQDREITFVYDGWNLFREVKTPVAGPAETKLYAWGLDLSRSIHGTGGIGGLLSMSHDNSLFMYTFNANGDVQQTVNAYNNSIHDSYEYDPSGNVIASTIDAVETNPFQYSSKYYDGESHLTYYGHRYYSGKLGKWIALDPITEDGGINLYAFSGNNGVNAVDILGGWAANLSKYALPWNWVLAWGDVTHETLVGDAFDDEKDVLDSKIWGTFVKINIGIILKGRNVSQDISGNRPKTTHLVPTERLVQSLGNPKDLTAMEKELVKYWENLKHYVAPTVMNFTEGHLEAMKHSDNYFDAMKSDYNSYLNGEKKCFNESLLDEKNPDCDEALTHLGWLSHTLQDYYGHGVGDPDSKTDPYNIYTKLNGNIGNPWTDRRLYPTTARTRGGAQHPGFGVEPVRNFSNSNKGYDDRVKNAIKITRELFKESLSEWGKKCACKRMEFWPIPKGNEAP